MVDALLVCMFSLAAGCLIFAIVVGWREAKRLEELRKWCFDQNSRDKVPEREGA